MGGSRAVQRLWTGLALGIFVVEICRAAIPTSFQSIHDLRHDAYLTLSIDMSLEGVDSPSENRFGEYGVDYFYHGWVSRDTRSFRLSSYRREDEDILSSWGEDLSSDSAEEAGSDVRGHESGRAAMGMDLASVAVLSQRSVQFRTSRVGVDLRAARVQRLGVGYNATLGLMDLGLRVNSYLAQLSRQVLVGSSVAADPNLANPILVPGAPVALSQAVGIDLGTTLGDGGRHLGVTVMNVNRPTLVYPSLMNDPSPANRASAQRLSELGQLMLTDRVQLQPQVVLDAAWSSSNGRWWLQQTVALNEASDFVGNPQRRAGLGVGIVPSQIGAATPTRVRLGYQRNLVGDGASAVELNLGWPTMNLGLRSGQVGDPAQGGFGQLRTVGVFLEFPSLP